MHEMESGMNRDSSLYPGALVRGTDWFGLALEAFDADVNKRPVALIHDLDSGGPGTLRIKKWTPALMMQSVSVVVR